jgi:hypothetical protein
MFTSGVLMSAKCARFSWFVLFAGLLFSSQLSAAESAVDRTGPPTASGISDELKKAVEERGYRITLDDGWTAEFWFSRALPTASKESPGALYPQLANGEFVALVTFTKGTSDYRGGAIAPGLYTLRYQYLPQDANHMGVSPNPDFLLAIPLSADVSPSEPTPYKRLVSLSTKASGTAHPAVIAMATAGTPAAVAKDDQSMTVLTVEVPTADPGKTLKLGIVLKGQATQ